MNIFGLQITRAEKTIPTTLAPVPVRNSWLGTIAESFSGAWQQHVTIDNRETLLAQSAVYACIDRIATDVSLFEMALMDIKERLWSFSDRQPSALRKPNDFQNRIQFLRLWMITKLTYGNAYILKERDGRGSEFQGGIRKMYVLDPRWVTPLISESGDMYYQLSQDPLNGVFETITVPASEIMHDRMSPILGHPICGISPLYAGAMSATQSRKIQNNSSIFFQNMSRPSGMLTAPGLITDEVAARLKALFEANFSGSNLGRLFVGGDGLKYEPMTIPASEAQLVEQLEWTIGDVARCFHLPLYKIGAGPLPTHNNISALNQQYYNECLWPHVEEIELLLSEGFGYDNLTRGVMMDTETLLRMDPKTRAETWQLLVRAGIMAPNEGRFKENLPPVKGGESPMVQEQNFSLEALAKRDAMDNPWAAGSPAQPKPQAPKPQVPKPDDEGEDEEKDLLLFDEQEVGSTIDVISTGLAYTKGWAYERALR